MAISSQYNHTAKVTVAKLFKCYFIWNKVFKEYLVGLLCLIHFRDGLREFRILTKSVNCKDMCTPSQSHDTSCFYSLSPLSLPGIRIYLQIIEEIIVILIGDSSCQNSTFLFWWKWNVVISDHFQILTWWRSQEESSTPRL